MKLGKRIIEEFQQVDPRDMSVLVPISLRNRVMMANWLDDRAEIAKRFNAAAGEQTGLPSLKFKQNLPVFIKTSAPSRMTKTQYGEREIIQVEIIEPKTMRENPPGTIMTMWITQEVFRTKLEVFRNKEGIIPGDLKLCIVNLGKVKGKRFSYNDYYIGTAEQGKKILEDLI